MTTSLIYDIMYQGMLSKKTFRWKCFEALFAGGNIPSLRVQDHDKIVEKVVDLFLEAVEKLVILQENVYYISSL